MRSTKANERNAPHRYHSWMGAATAAALVAGSVTMSMAAPRGGAHMAAQQGGAASFHWQAFTPGHITRIETPGGSQGSIGNVHTDALQAPPAGFTWQTFSPGHMVHNDRPNGAGTGSSGDQTSALRLPLTTFHWQTFTPGHVVDSQPANGTSTSAPGGLHSDAMRAALTRPTLFTGLDRDGAGGVRADVGLSFRIP